MQWGRGTGVDRELAEGPWGRAGEAFQGTLEGRLLGRREEPLKGAMEGWVIEERRDEDAEVSWSLDVPEAHAGHARTRTHG